MLCALFYGCFQWKKRLTRNREALLSRTNAEIPATSKVIEESSMTQVHTSSNLFCEFPMILGVGSFSDSDAYHRAFVELLSLSTPG